MMPWSFVPGMMLWNLVFDACSCFLDIFICAKVPLHSVAPKCRVVFHATWNFSSTPLKSLISTVRSMHQRNSGGPWDDVAELGL